MEKSGMTRMDSFDGSRVMSIAALALPMRMFMSLLVEKIDERVDCF